MTKSIAVVGAGAWGTALAVHLSRRADLRISLCARDAAQANAMVAGRVNARYLPGVALPASLVVASSLAIVADADLIVVATPVAALPAVAGDLAAAGARAPLVWLVERFSRRAGERSLSGWRRHFRTSTSHRCGMHR